MASFLFFVANAGAILKCYLTFYPIMSDISQTSCHTLNLFFDPRDIFLIVACRMTAAIPDVKVPYSNANRPVE